MRSIIEEIASAEERADKIRADAAASSRDAVTAAREKAARELNDLEMEEREKLARALGDARSQGEEIAREMLKKMDRETDALCEKADGRLDGVVGYLLEKVQKTA